MAFNPTDNLFVQRSPYAPTDYLRVDGKTLFDIANNIQPGTRMLFMQASAPAGWTQDTSRGDSLVSVTSGGTGGTAYGTIGASVFHSPAYTYNLTIVGPLAFGLAGATLTEAQLPSHLHAIGTLGYGGGCDSKDPGGGNRGPGCYSSAGSTTAEGGSGAHFHSFSGSSFNITSPAVTNNFDVAYADSIECVRN
jgi:hypothetical protein